MRSRRRRVGRYPRWRTLWPRRCCASAHLARALPTPTMNRGVRVSRVSLRASQTSLFSAVRDGSWDVVQLKVSRAHDDAARSATKLRSPNVVHAKRSRPLTSRPAPFFPPFPPTAADEHRDDDRHLDRRRRCRLHRAPSPLVPPRREFPLRVRARRTVNHAPRARLRLHGAFPCRDRQFSLTRDARHHALRPRARHHRNDARRAPPLLRTEIRRQRRPRRSRDAAQCRRRRLPGSRRAPRRAR